MPPTTIPIPLPGGLETPLPRMRRARQRFNAEEVADPAAAIAAEFQNFAHIDLRGKTVAIGVGSRGIRSQGPVLHAVIAELKAAGAAPFLVPAMGSHGGGTAEGQQKILEGYGFGEAETGVPIRASMEAVELARIADDLPVYCDRHALGADYIVAINRVKPHTSFRGPVESGLCKMLAIGLGKHKGAEALHRRGMARFGELLPIAAKAILAKTRLLFAAAIVENGYEKLHKVELVGPDDLIDRDVALQNMAKDLLPRILIPKIDFLIVDQIGKDISGAGMDPNVIGGNPLTAGDGQPDIRVLLARDLTPGAGGNATGIGYAQVTTQRLVQKIDWTKTYVNVVTSGSPRAAALPLVAETDRDAVFIGLRSCPSTSAETVRVVRIENTLDLGEIWVSEALIPAVDAHPDMDLMGDAFALRFDDAGGLTPFH